MSMNPAEVLCQLVVDGIREEDGRIHAETAIATTAALTGECALRVAKLDLSRVHPGQAVFSDRVNTVLFGDTETSLWGLMRDILPRVGLSGDLVPPVAELAENAAAHVYDGGPWPYLTVPDENRPHRPPLQLAALFRGQFHHLARTFRLHTDLQMAAAALACARFVSLTRDVLAPAVGARLAFEIIIGVSKTCPLTSADQSVDPDSFGRVVVRFEDGAAH
jgi:hypothetical protein